MRSTLEYLMDAGDNQASHLLCNIPFGSKLRPIRNLTLLTSLQVHTRYLVICGVSTI